MNTVGNMDQRDILQTLKELKNLTRDELSQLIGCTKRQLDTWILPVDSKQRRTMSGKAGYRAEKLLEEALREKALIDAGKLKRGEESEISFTSSLSGVTYPPIYRVEVPNIEYTEELVRIEGSPEVVGHRFINPRDTGEVHVGHVFTTDSRYICEQDGFLPSFEPVKSLGDVEYWLTIRKLEGLEEWSGTVSAHFSSPDYLVHQNDNINLIQTKHGYFVCNKYYGDTSNSEKLNGHIIYISDYEKTNEVIPALTTDTETVIIKPDGTVIEGSDGEQYLSELLGHED